MLHAVPGKCHMFFNKPFVAVSMCALASFLSCTLTEQPAEFWPPESCGEEPSLLAPWSLTVIGISSYFILFY